jgi:hypothetical protein
MRNLIRNTLAASAAILTGLYAHTVFAAITITSPTSDPIWHQRSNLVVVRGTASPASGTSISRIRWACLSNCRQNGITSANSGSWSTGTITLDPGSNNVRVTVEYNNGTSDTDDINLYQTIAGTTNVVFPYALPLDDADELEARYTATDGASITHVTGAQCWRNGCARFVPVGGTNGFDGINTYAALGGFRFPPNSRTVFVRYLMYFGPDFITHVDRSIKHIIMHRGDGVGDDSDDRAMSYIWRTPNLTNFTIGACDNIDCFFDENASPDPSNTDSFLVGNVANSQWVALEAEFDTSTTPNRVRIRATTEDGVLNETVIASRTMAPTNSSPQNYFRELSILGAFVDRGTRASPGMYFLLDEIAMSNSYIGPPAGFVTGNPSTRARPSAPVLLSVD